MDAKQIRHAADSRRHSRAAMYERFTDPARNVMRLANQEAKRLNHQYIGTEHILLGLLKDGSGVAASVLINCDVTSGKVRLQVEDIVEPGPDIVIMGKLPQTPRAKKVIEHSLNEARGLNHRWVGTAHLLMGLMRERDGIAANVLMNLGLELGDVRAAVLTALKDPKAPIEQIESRSRGFGRWLRGWFVQH